jgi:hypothetical protein
MELVRDIWMVTLGVLFSALIVIAAYYRKDLENHPGMGMVFMILGFISTIVFFGGIFVYIGAALVRSILGIFG